MAGNWCSGRVGWRHRIDDYVRVDVMELKRDGVFEVGQPGLQVAPSCPEAALEYCEGLLTMHWLRPAGRGPYSEVKQPVVIEHTPCRFGGSRPWFRCPKCGLESTDVV